MILSIDIGRKNMGYALFRVDPVEVVLVEYGLYALNDKSQLTRMSSLCSFLSKFEISCMIVERQVCNNVIAMQIMSGIIMYCEMKGLECVLFNPKDKFVQGEKWKGKEHKKLSVTYATHYLSLLGLSLIDCTKKESTNTSKIKYDDIADAILMGLRTLCDNYVELIGSV